MPDADRRILLLGSGGQVGHELSAELSPLGRVTALDRAAADLGELDSLQRVVRRHGPDVIVNAAAYTAVDRAESETALAHLVNAESPRVLAEEAERLGACLVHYSTDYVLDGKKEFPYTEADQPCPISVYGSSKLAGELAVAACHRHVIFRTSWVFGAHGSSFLKTILRLAGERESLRVVADQWGAPTSARLIASVTTRFLGQALSGRGDGPDWGLYHVAASGATNWFAYAQYIVSRGQRTGMPLKLSPASIQPIASADYPVAAQRPPNSRLDTSKVRKALGIELPEWEHDFDQVIHEMSGKGFR